MEVKELGAEESSGITVFGLVAGVAISIIFLGR